jgi:tetratricopeptide (TPR) repeat protein
VKSRIEKAPTNNLDAYAFYLKGRELYFLYKKDDNEKAIQLFKKAISLDSNYALAYAGLADAYSMRVGRWGYDKGLLDSAFELGNIAISHAPELAEGYKALGLVYEFRGQRFNKAIESYRKAIELNPNYWPAVTNLGNLSLFMGRLDEAVFWDRKSITLNVSNPESYGNLAMAWLLLCVDSLAERYYKKKSELRGDQSFHGDLSEIYLRQGKYTKAHSEIEKALSVDSTDWGVQWTAGLICLIRGENQKALKFCGVDSVLLGYLYWKTGKQQTAKGIFDRKLVELERSLQDGNEMFDKPIQIGIIHAIEGQKEKAFYYLNKAIEFGYLDYRQFQIWPMLESLRNDDQFKQMVAQMKSKVDLQRIKVEEMEKAESQ